MDHLNDLPVSLLLNLLSFLYGDLAVNLLSKQKGAYHWNGAAIRDLAAVSKAWAAAIEGVTDHFRDSVLSFDFQQDPVANEEEKEEHNAKFIYDNNHVIPANNEPSGGIFQLVWGLLTALSCTSNDRPSRTLSDEEDSKELILSNKKEVQMQRKAQHVESELKRLLEEVATGKHPRLRVELWLNDPLDVTICNYEGKSMGDDVLQHWESVFSNCQYLVRLDLSGVPMESDHLPAILNAAGENCANLEELVMPQQTHLMPRRRSVHDVLEAFHVALISLEALSRSRKRGGLKKLVLPWLFPIENVDITAAVIGEHCPSLEHIEGLRLAAFSRKRRLTSVEMRRSGLESWEAFCKGCSHLVKLDWCSLPCSDEMFDIFASHPKLALKSLVLPGNTALWRREYVLQERHHVEALSPSNRVGPVFRGCPNLTSLKILLSDMQGESECLDDQFLRHVADVCPHLEKLALVEASGHHGFGPSNAFTNEGLTALKNLRHLQTIELSGVEFSEETLILHAARPRPPGRPRTSIDVTLSVRGWSVVDVAKCFHETITKFLDILLVSEASEYPAFIVRVRPDTHNYSPPAMWEAHFASEWITMKRELTWRVPNIHFYYDYLRTEATIECQPLTKTRVGEAAANIGGTHAL